MNLTNRWHYNTFYCIQGLKITVPIPLWTSKRPTPSFNHIKHNKYSINNLHKLPVYQFYTYKSNVDVILGKAKKVVEYIFKITTQFGRQFAWKWNLKSL